MPAVAVSEMRAYLAKSISSLNQNKLNGLLAELDFRRHLEKIGFSGRVSQGGWILRRTRDDFGSNPVVLFPEVLRPGVDYPINRAAPVPPVGLHTICATFHQTGIKAFFCFPEVHVPNSVESIHWKGVQLGLPTESPSVRFPDHFFPWYLRRTRRHNFLRSRSDVSRIPEDMVAEEFAKEHLRISFSDRCFAEISDVDGIFWGEQFTYPLEIKEKTSANDANIGEFFGLDIGPFVKLAFYAAKRGNLHSLFIVREIDSPVSRNLLKWWFITYEQLASYASWVPTAGGRNMQGGGSAVVRIPKHQFRELTASNLGKL